MELFEFHHVGIAVRSLTDSASAFEAMFGYKVDSGPFDDPIQDVSVQFLSRGANDPCLELVAPLGPNSPIKQTLKKGGGTYHICYQVPDIHAAIQHLTSNNAFLLGDPKPAIAFEMREIAWLLTEPGVLVELLQG
jgi:methylmalonyl-CoA/ethylmalonyl-CoA epimerase